MLTLPVAINIILADDHDIYREGFRSIISKAPFINILTEVSSCKNLISAIRNFKPDVIIANVEMNEGDCLVQTKKLINRFPSQKVIALSSCHDKQLMIDVLDIGAKGYLQKNAPKEDIVAAIKSVHRNKIYYCKQTERHLAEMAKGTIGIRGKKPKIDFTENEIKVIRMICDELGNKEIADQLCLSKRTVEGYREKILEKINAKNTAGIVIYAVKHKIFELEKAV